MCSSQLPPAAFRAFRRRCTPAKADQSLWGYLEKQSIQLGGIGVCAPKKTVGSITASPLKNPETSVTGCPHNPPSGARSTFQLKSRVTRWPSWSWANKNVFLCFPMFSSPRSSFHPRLLRNDAPTKSTKRYALYRLCRAETPRHDSANVIRSVNVRKTGARHFSWTAVQEVLACPKSSCIEL